MSESNKPLTILEKIYAQRAKDVEAAKASPGTTPQDIDTLLQLNLAPPLISFVERLKRNPSTHTSSPSPSLMAEIKRASPSKGPIAMNANAAQQAQIYALSGASVISVLTEPTWFKGTLLDMRLVRQAVDSFQDRPAILRKDFILEEYQIAEARLHGADTILLIVAMLSQERLKKLYAYSLSLGMEPLVEVNNASEMDRALEIGSKVIGVNNRNLHDFQVDMGTTSRLVEMVQQRDVILCALSGISSPNDVRVYKDQGVRAVLVGEALMRAADTSAFISDLLGWPGKEPDQTGWKDVWVSVTGVETVEEALSLTESGIDMIRIVLIPDHENSIPLDTASHISSQVRALRVPPFLEAHPPENTTPWFTTHARNIKTSGPRPLLVGIFKNQPLPYIIHATAVAQLDLVQLDGTEPAGWIPYIQVPVIRGAEFRKGESIPNDIKRPGFHAFTSLDIGQDVDLSDWQAMSNLAELPNWPMPIILTGGLTSENVDEAVRVIRPWAVDIGKVDIATAYALIQKVKM